MIIIVDFSISSSLWIISSPVLGGPDKIEYIFRMIIFGLLPFILPVMFKVQRFIRKKSGNQPYSEESLKKQKRFEDLFFFLYTILLFSLNRVMDFIELDGQSYFILKTIYVISSNIFVGFFFYVIEIKHKMAIFIIALVTLNLVAVLGLFL